MSVSAREGQASDQGTLGVPVLVRDQEGSWAALETLRPEPVETNEVHAPSANTAAILTFAAAEFETAHCLSGLAWSYGGSGTLAGGNLKIEDGSETIFSMDIGAKGQDAIYFEPAKMGTPGRAMTATLAAGGADVSGKLNALGHWLRHKKLVGAANLNNENNSGLIPVLL